MQNKASIIQIRKKGQLSKYEKKEEHSNKPRKDTKKGLHSTVSPFFHSSPQSTKSRSKLKPASNPFPNTRFIPHFFSVYKKRDSKLQIHQETFRPPLYPIPYSCPPYDGQHPSLTMSSRGPSLSQEHSDNHVNDALYRLTC